MAKILAITGANGQKSGGHFVKILSENMSAVKEMFPDGIRLFTRPTANVDELRDLIPQSEFFAGDIEESDLLEPFLKNVDTLVNIAGIHCSLKLVNVAAKCKVRRLILVHTTGIYSKYKVAGEEYRNIDEKVYEICKENGILLTICRPTMIYGNVYDNNVVKFIKMVDTLPIMPVVNHARYELQPVHYKDLSKAYYDILMNEQKTNNKDYILSGGAPIQLREMFLLMGKHLGKKVKFINCPFFIAYFGAWVVFCLSFGKFDYREKVQRLCEPRVYSFEDAANDFGYAPVPFEVGIGDEIEEYMAMK